jgi:hypothetical protein
MRKRVILAAVAVLAGCGGSEEGGGKEPPATATRAAAPKTGGPMTPRGVLEAKGYVVIPRSNVALRSPKGFVVEASIPGLARQGSRSTFLVFQAKSSYNDPQAVVDDAMAVFKDEQAVARQGIEFDSVTRLEVDGRPAVGATGTQTAQGAQFNKAVVEFASEGYLVTMTATLETGDPVSAADALAVLRQARWASKAAAGGFGFAIAPAKGYQKVASSVALSYTLNGDSGPGVAQFLAQESKGATPASGRREAARARFAALPGSPEPTSEREVEIAGRPGWELTGAGKEFGRETHVYAAILFTDDGYVLLVGTFDPDRYPTDQVPAFRSMARSFKPTP